MEHINVGAQGSNILDETEVYCTFHLADNENLFFKSLVDAEFHHQATELHL